MAAKRERGELTRADVIAAALAIVDAGGVDACTIRALATKLGVTPMAIYWHVPNKDALLDAVLEAVLAGIQIGDQPADPFDALAEGARRYRLAFVRHPHVVPLLATRSTMHTPPAKAIMLKGLALLERAGLAGSQLTCAYLLLSQFVMGSVMTEHGDGVRPIEASLADLPDAGTRFEFGLSCLLAGVRALVTPEPSTR